MFKMHLKRDKDAIKHLSTINKDFVFLNGAMCSMHPGLYAFGVFFSGDVSVDHPTVRECGDFIDGVIKSKEMDEIIFDVDGNKFSAVKPYKFMREMPEKDDATDSIGEVEKRLGIISSIGEIGENSVFTDADGVDRNVALFEVDNAILLDMLQHMGEENDVTLTTGKQLTIETSTAVTELEFLKPLKEVSIVITEDTLPFLKSAFIEPEMQTQNAERPTSKICIIDESFIIITNKVATIINSSL